MHFGAWGWVGICSASNSESAARSRGLATTTLRASLSLLHHRPQDLALPLRRMHRSAVDRDAVVAHRLRLAGAVNLLLALRFRSEQRTGRARPIGAAAARLVPRRRASTTPASGPRASASDSSSRISTPEPPVCPCGLIWARSPAPKPHITVRHRTPEPLILPRLCSNRSAANYNVSSTECPLRRFSIRLVRLRHSTCEWQATTDNSLHT